jgi:hypothetical protein
LIGSPFVETEIGGLSSSLIENRLPELTTLNPSEGVLAFRNLRTRSRMTAEGAATALEID